MQLVFLKALELGNIETYLAKLHILLDTIHTTLKLRSGGVHISDHAAHVTDDSGKDQDPDKVVDRH
jgi:hypothetical protein